MKNYVKAIIAATIIGTGATCGALLTNVSANKADSVPSTYKETKLEAPATAADWKATVEKRVAAASNKTINEYVGKKILPTSNPDIPLDSTAKIIQTASKPSTNIGTMTSSLTFNSSAAAKQMGSTRMHLGSTTNTPAVYADVPVTTTATYSSDVTADTYLLAKIISAECGANWVPVRTKMMFGEVVLNRVVSPEFANTVSGVIYAPGQYYEPIRHPDAFARRTPTTSCLEAAKRLMAGERVLNDKSIVFQAEFRQGSNVAAVYHDPVRNTTTYFCRSSHMNNYR